MGLSPLPPEASGRGNALPRGRRGARSVPASKQRQAMSPVASNVMSEAKEDSEKKQKRKKASTARALPSRVDLVKKEKVAPPMRKKTPKTARTSAAKTEKQTDSKSERPGSAKAPKKVPKTRPKPLLHANLRDHLVPSASSPLLESGVPRRLAHRLTRSPGPSSQASPGSPTIAVEMTASMLAERKASAAAAKSSSQPRSFSARNLRLLTSQRETLGTPPTVSPSPTIPEEEDGGSNRKHRKVKSSRSLRSSHSAPKPAKKVVYSKSPPARLPSQVKPKPRRRKAPVAAEAPRQRVRIGVGRATSAKLRTAKKLEDPKLFEIDEDPDQPGATRNSTAVAKAPRGRSRKEGLKRGRRSAKSVPTLKAKPPVGSKAPVSKSKSSGTALQHPIRKPKVSHERIGGAEAVYQAIAKPKRKKKLKRRATQT